MPLQKGKNAIIRGNGRWRGIREADYKRTKAGDKDKGDSALTVLSVRHLVHSIFGTRHFHFWKQSFSKAFFSEWLDVRFLENLRVMKIKDDDIFLAKDKIKEAILLKENDILTPAVTSLENIGKMARVDSDMPDTTVGGFVFIIRLHLINQWFSKYILCLLSSPFMIDFMRSITNKSGQAFYNIGKERLSTALLPIPPLVEQHRIVAQIEKLFEQLR